jgi:DNA-binding NarL/FixJ family response regulator
MKILIIDRDTMFSSLLAAKLRAAGHDVIESAVKQDGIEALGSSNVDVVYFDPSPMTDPKGLLLQIRRMVYTYPYLVLMGHGTSRMDAVRAGCNEALSKPLDPQKLSETLENAARLCPIIQRLGDTRYDFPSAGGVISKSAFNQLFISAMDRVSRYEETARVLFIGIKNYDDVKLDEGKLGADMVVSKLAQNLSRLRRQSDILGQTEKKEYALLLQRPQGPMEAMDAARRFGAAIDSLKDLSESGLSPVELYVNMIDLPSGTLEYEHTAHHPARIGLAAQG